MYKNNLLCEQWYIKLTTEMYSVLCNVMIHLLFQTVCGKRRQEE